MEHENIKVGQIMDFVFHFQINLYGFILDTDGQKSSMMKFILQKIV